MSRLRLVLAALIGSLAFEAQAQQLVIDGLYGCERATNGRAYCKKHGSSNYVPVSDEFFNKFETVRTGRPLTPPPAPATVTNVTNTNVTVVVQGLTNEASDLKGQALLLDTVVAEQERIRSGLTGVEAEATEQTVVVLKSRAAELRGKLRGKLTELSKYSTSIRPEDQDQYLTARKASEIYPKVPYYIPGTPETGEFWVEPYVRDDGTLVFRFRFIDPSSTNEKTRSAVEMTADELERTQKALFKTFEWSKVAHQNRVRKYVSKRVVCFPELNCPEEGKRLDGKSSTEVIFQVSEEGATSGRIQRNKGRFDEGYNFSIDSALLLQAYLKHVLKEGRLEYRSNTEDVNELFK